MPWTKTLWNFGIELEGKGINIEVNPDTLERLGGPHHHRETGNLPKFSTHPLTIKRKIITNVRMTNLETVKRRLMNIVPKVHNHCSLPCQGLVHDIEGNQDINDVFKDIESIGQA